MKILVTGGAGFIGSHLVLALLQAGHSVRVIDDLSAGSLENMNEFSESDSFHFIKSSILDEAITGEAVNWCDSVLHLAAAVGVKRIVDDPVGSIHTNFETTSVVLEAANINKKNVLIASTSEVYGNNPEVPFREDSNPVIGSTQVGRWSYACTKALDEFLALAYHSQFGLPVVVVRLFNTVGPRQAGRYGMVLPRFVQQALQGVPLTVYGDGTQSRCFVHVSDVVEGVIGLLNTRDSTGNIYNVGNDEEITIGDLAQKVIDLTESDSEIEFVPYDKVYGGKFEDMQRRIPDLTKIKDLIGYKPKMGLDATINSVVSFYRDSAPNSNFTIE